jgi:DNA repair protein RecN (Recombination protein N)
MLRGLSIRDVVLVDKLELEFGPGLAVLTGETGAGKSILLDALGLAMGARGDAGLVRHGAQQAVVTAEFDAAPGAADALKEHGIPADGPLVLRRIVTADGRSRAFVNDEPVSVGFLRTLGDSLVEVHGQSDQRGLLDAGTHRAALDSFAGARAQAGDARARWAAAEAARKALDEAKAARARAAADEDFLRHALKEMDTLDPKDGEEREIEERRTLLKSREKIMAALDAARRAMEEPRPAGDALRTARRELARVADKIGLDKAIAALDRAADEMAEAEAAIEAAGRAIDHDSNALERLEDRLYALRELARKHRVPVDGLSALRARIAGQLEGLDKGEKDLAALDEAATSSRATFAQAARRLSALRQEAAAKLDEAVAKELAPVKLGEARFHTRLDALAEADWSADGAERVSFEVATNPGQPFGPIGRIASGGELSRFMLALRVALAEVGGAGTLVFDEVDAGVGGATAAAVGERLARLGRAVQVLVVTHSPQVAARGEKHWRVSKAAEGGTALTRVTALDAEARREEVARMLSGARVTDEARAAADSLMAPPRAKRAGRG